MSYPRDVNVIKVATFTVGIASTNSHGMGACPGYLVHPWLTPPTELLTQHSVLFQQIVDDLLLAAVEPTDNSQDPELQDDRVHCRERSRLDRASTQATKRSNMPRDFLGPRFGTLRADELSSLSGTPLQSSEASDARELTCLTRRRVFQALDAIVFAPVDVLVVDRNTV